MTTNETKRPESSAERPSAEQQLKNYATHATVQQLVVAFQTNITTTANLFLLATGGIWAIIIPNSFNLDDWVLITGLVLHLILGLMTWWALRGAVIQIIQRFVFLQNIGEVYWPDIKAIGIAAMAEARRGLLVPGPRQQARFWCYIPLVLALADVPLIVSIVAQGPLDEDCRDRAELLRDAASVHEVDRARYLIEKAGCDPRRFQLRPFIERQAWEQAERATTRQQRADPSSEGAPR